MFKILLTISLLNAENLLLFTPPKNKWNTPLDNSVSVLTNETFDPFLKTQKYMFVKFFAPWCGHCKSMAQDYSKLAKKMINDPNGIPITQVDCTVERPTCQEYSIGGYPALRFFIHGEALVYHGERSKEAIEEYISSKIRASAQEIKNQAEFEKIKDQKNSVILFLSNQNDEQLSIFNGLISFFEEASFYFVYMTNLEFPPSEIEKKEFNVLVFKDKDIFKLVKNELISMQELKQFIDRAEKPIVIEATDDLLNDIFSNGRLSIFLFYKHHSDQVIEEFKESAKKNADLGVFVQVPFSELKYGNLYQILGVKKEDEAVVLIVGFQNGEPIKYRASLPITSLSLNSFYNSYRNEELPVYYKSQDVLENEKKGNVDVIVGRNFLEKITSQKKIVFLKIYSPTCFHCKELEPVFEKLARKYRNNKSIVFAEFDGKENETPHLKIDQFPELKLYLNGELENPIAYRGERTFKALKKFLKENVPELNILKKAEGQVEGDTETL